MTSSRLPRPLGSVFSDLVQLEHPGIEPEVLEAVLRLAVQIAREGREGRKIGTLFTLGDADEVLRRSRPLILDPLAGHPDELKRIDASGLPETVKELAQLDGAFVVTGDGVVRSAARYIDVRLSDDLELPLGLGSRHLAAASISRTTDCMAVVVSDSSMVRVFQEGELVSEILPELWMLRTYGQRLLGNTSLQSEDELTVVTRAPDPDE